MRAPLAVVALLALAPAAACTQPTGASDGAGEAAAPAARGGRVETLDSAELAALVEAGKVRLIDVRTPAEFAGGSIAGAINIPLDRFDPAAIAEEPGRETVLLCRSDRRSGLAAEQLAAARGGTVRHLEGGVLAWVEQGLALTGAD